MTHAEKAAELFDKGYNCSQSVAGAFSEETGMDTETICAMTAGFGGGVGRLREVCGALSGMTFVAGRLMSSGKADADDKAKIYAFIQQIAEEFRLVNKSIICRELLGLDASSPLSPTPEARTQEYYQKRPCREIVASGADILSKALEKQGII